MVLKSHIQEGRDLPSVFEKFDGIRPMAAKLNVPVSTVSSWKRNRCIPAWRHREILAVADRDGIPLDVDELVHLRPDEIPPEERRSRRARAPGEAAA